MTHPQPGPPAAPRAVKPLPARHNRYDRTVFVANPNGTRTRVRWSITRRQRWRCDDHGAMAAAGCPHTHAAALGLAADLLGLVLHPSLTPRPLKEQHS